MCVGGGGCVCCPLKDWVALLAHGATGSGAGMVDVLRYLRQSCPVKVVPGTVSIAPSLRI